MVWHSKLADIISTYLEQRFPNEEEVFLLY